MARVRLELPEGHEFHRPDGHLFLVPGQVDMMLATGKLPITNIGQFLKRLEDHSKRDETNTTEEQAQQALQDLDQALKLADALLERCSVDPLWTAEVRPQMQPNELCLKELDYEVRVRWMMELLSQSGGFKEAKEKLAPLSKTPSS